MYDDAQQSCRHSYSIATTLSQGHSVINYSTDVLQFIGQVEASLR